MRGNYRISVVIPCHNEEEGIEKILSTMPDFVDEVVVVDNNSEDRTAEVARRYSAKVVVETRQGYGAAYKKGLKEVNGDIIVTMDGDATYPRIAIAYLLDILFEDNLDFISVWRVAIDWRESTDYMLRYIGNRIFNLTILLLYQRHIHDSQSGMWVFKKSLLELVTLKSDGMPFSQEFKLEVFTNKNIRAREVPIQFSYFKRRGESKLSLWRDGIKNYLHLFIKRWEMLFNKRRKNRIRKR
ncbi:MAG: glycosyltransferase family 2 protein [bacterium]